MAIPDTAFAQGDVYTDYPREQVMFRWDHTNKKVFRKFYGDEDEDEVPYSDELFADSRQVNETKQITAEQYQAGKKATT